MSCHRWQKKISSVLDGEASALQIQRVEDHLKHCFNCQKFMESMQKSYSLLDDGFQLEASELFFQDILTNVRRPTRIVPSRTWGQKLLVPATVCAGLIVGIFIGIQLYSLKTNDMQEMSQDQLDMSSYRDLGVFEPLPPGSITANYITLTTSE